MATSKTAISPEDVFLEKARKDGRAARRDVALVAIGVPDLALQARVDHLSESHCEHLSRILESQGELAPVILFRDATMSRLYLADGHHRHAVYRRAERQLIPAWVVDSTRPYGEALEYATMCNRNLCLPRKAGDIHKAIRMLLSDEVWWHRNNTWIAEHVGSTPQTVSVIRATMATKDGRSLPDRVVARHGFAKPYRIDPAGTTKPIDTREALLHRRKNLVYANVYAMAQRIGFAGIYIRGRNTHPGLRCLHRAGIVAFPCDLSQSAAIPASVGQLILARQKTDATRMILIGHIEDGLKAVVELVMAAGIEILSLESLVDELTAEPRRNPACESSEHCCS